MKNNICLRKLFLVTTVLLCCWLTAKTQSELSDGNGVAQNLRGEYLTGKVLVIVEEGYLFLLISENGTEVNKSIQVMQPKNFTEKERKVFDKAQVLYLGGVVVINDPQSGFRYIFRVVGIESSVKAFGKLPASYFSAATVIDAVGIGSAVPWVAIPVENFKEGVAVSSVLYK